MEEKFKDYYKILGVSKDATQDQIKKAYRKLARKYHPDRNKGDKAAEEKFKEINEAYEVLGNEENRRKYDEVGMYWRQYDEYKKAQEQAKQAGFGGFGGFGGPGGGSYHFEGDLGDLEDIFNMFGGGFGGFTGQRTRYTNMPRKGRDYRAEMTLSFDEVVNGATRIIDLGHKKIRVRIKPGAYDGQVIKIPGKGAPGINGGPAGDLYITIHTEGDPRFVRKGSDLYTTVEVDDLTAVLGGKAMVDTPAGKIQMTIPAGTSCGKTLRIRGKGLPVYGQPGQFGDLYATVKIIVPKHLTDEEKKLYEQLKKLRK
ncbi:MAG: J domain-containing protein [Chlorobi bacterium]|nr:J domain-containing protein [Chlorobiota bacterium]